MTSLLTLLTLPAALAQSYNAHGFTLVPSDGDLHDPLAAWRPEVQVKRSFGIQALLEYAHAPLVLYGYNDEGRVVAQPLVDNLVGVNMGGTYAVNRRLALTLSMPIWAHAEDIDGDSQPALGDLRFAAPIGIIVPKAQEGVSDANLTGFMLSLVPFANLPSGNESLYLGSGGFGGGGLLAVGWGSPVFQIFANGGAEYAPAFEYENLTGGPIWKANLGASVRVAQGLAVRAEGTLNASMDKNDVAYAEAPAEVLLSLRSKAKKRGLNFTLGGAKAVTPGAGAATYRAFAGAGWTFGKDSKPAPVVPTDLTVIVQTPKGDPIALAQVTMGNRVLTTDSTGRVTFVELKPGDVDALEASAKDYKPKKVEKFALQVGPNERIIVLDPMDSQLKVIALDDKGLPHDARVRFLEGPADQAMVKLGPDGEETTTLGAGDWELLVVSDKHLPQQFKIHLDPGEFETLTVHFAGEKVNVCTEKVTLRNVNFDFDVDTPREDSLPTLVNIALSLKDCPEVVVEVGGHTDSKGSDAYNIDLSQRRMNSVKTILVSNGVRESQIVAVGYGESKPIATNKTDKGRALNRRVEFNPIKGGENVIQTPGGTPISPVTPVAPAPEVTPSTPVSPATPEAPKADDKKDEDKKKGK